MLFNQLKEHAGKFIDLESLRMQYYSHLTWYVQSEQDGAGSVWMMLLQKCLLESNVQVMDWFGGETVWYTKALTADKFEAAPVGMTFFMATIVMVKDGNLQDEIDKSYAAEHLQPRLDSEGNISHLRYKKISVAPRILSIQVVRTRTPGPQGLEIFRSALHYGLELNLGNCRSESVNEVNSEYQLVGLIARQTRWRGLYSLSEHYLAVCSKRFERSGGLHWYLMDDNIVTEIPVDAVLDFSGGPGSYCSRKDTSSNRYFAELFLYVHKDYLEEFYGF
jgi:hypothetical protein